MNILVFGATGKTGRQIVRQALERGHHVCAFVRDPAGLEARDQLKTVTGDILDPASVERAFEPPVDAVLSALGIFHREPRTDLSEGTRSVIAAMEKSGVRRFVVVSSLGVGDSAGQGNLLARGLQKMLLSHVLDDKGRQEQLIEDSALDWTVVRPPQLTDDERIVKDVVAWQGPSPSTPKLSWKTSRATVASFVLDTVESGTYLRAAVNISEPR